MASSKNAGRRRFITRQHTSDTSEADATIATAASTVKTPEEEEECERRRLEKISLPRDTPSAFVRVAPSSSSSSSSKSAALDWTFRGSKNGLAVPSSSRRLPHPHHHQQQQQPSVPLNCEPNNAPFHQLASEKIVQQQPLIYATLETSTGFPPDCDSLSLGFRPIRRDSLGSTSSSLAGSTVDSELTISNTAPPDQPFDSSPQRIVKLPPHPAGGKDFPDSSASKLRPWSYYDGGGMLGPRTVLSSTGSASSYDNLDKMDSSSAQRNTLQLNSDATQVHLSPSPRFARTKHFDGGDPKRTPSPPSIRRHGSPFRSDDDRQFYVVGSRTTHGNRDAASKETMSGEDKGEGPHFLDGVCRRRMAGGHVQVIPPHLVGVFDPSRFLPTNVHAPSDANASGYVDLEKSNPPSVTKQPESTAYHPMGKLPSKLPVQPGYVRSSETSGKSLLPRVSGQHTSRDVVDHSSSGHANPILPFATKDSGLSTGESLSSTSKVNASRKSYRNEDLPAKDASPKFSDKRLFSTGRKGGCNVSSQEQESVTDLFHHVLPNTDSSAHYGGGGPVFKDAGHHYPSAHHEPKDPQTSLSKPSAYLSTNHSSPSKQGSPKYAQTSTQKSSPKWESSISSRGGKKYEQTSSPKTSPKIVPRHNDQTSTMKSSPKWERTSSAKSNLASSPKSSPKQERTAAGRRNMKWEVPNVTSAKASQQSTKSISKWEPASSSKDNARSKVSSSLTAAAATGDHLLASFSGTSNLEKAEGVENERIIERMPYNRTVSDTGQSRSQSAIAESIRSQEKPRVPGDTSLTRTRSDRDKRKVTTSTQPPAVVTPDSVFSARRKQLSTTDRFDHRSRTDVTVDRASRSTTTTRQNTDDGRDTSMIDRGKPEAGNSSSEIKTTLDVRSSNSPRKAADDAVCPSDAASDRTSSTSSSLHGIENKGGAEERQRLRKSESGESDAHSRRSSAQSAEVVKVSLGEDAVREQTVMDVGAMEAGSAAAAVAGGDGLDATLDVYAINSNNAKDSVALKSTEDATVVSNGTGSTTVVADASTDDKEVNANVGDHGDLEVPRSKVRLSCPQTKTFTDILESIQVVTQPCGGALTVSSSQDTPGTTPVFGPPTSSSSVHNFPLFDVNDEPVVIKSSQSSLPDEVFASTPVDVSKKSLECITDQPSSVGQLILSGERSPGSCPVESAQRKTEQNADVVNNNLKETSPSTQTICLGQSEISSPVLHERRSLDSISSSSLVELPTKEELLADESSNVRTTATEPIYSVSVAQQQLRYPAVVDKAIFTVDKEISFVSGLLEPDKRGSLPGKLSSQISLQDAGHMEFLSVKSESSPNAKLLMESAPFMLVTVSSVSTTDREREAVPQSFSFVDKMPGAFQNPALTNVHAFPTVQSTTSHLNVADHRVSREKSPLSPIATLPSVFDCCPLNEPINQNSSAILTNKNDDLVGRDKVVSDLDESDDETVDHGGNESKVSTASLDQLTQETEIFELAKTSAAYLKPEITSTSSITFFPPVPPPTKTEESLCTAGKTQLLVTPSTTTISKPVLSQNHDSAKHAFVFTSKESLPVNVNEQPAYHPGIIDNRLNASPFKSEVSPVMAALDDALAVLTSVVMENKTTGGDTLPRSAASAMPSKKDALKPDAEKVMLSLNTDTKKAGRSKSTNKEGTSSSATKKRPGVASHKEQQQQQQQQHALFRSSPIATSHHSDPLEVMETVRQEIETVENRRRHRLSKDDSFNRPDSPMFHETLPLPKDSIIKRNREHCHDSSSSSDSGGGSPQASPRLAPRNLRRSKRGGQDAAASKSGSATTPLEMPGYRPFMGGHASSGRTLSRHQSDIVLDMQSLPTTAGQHLHRTRRHNSDSADPGKGPWPKTVSLAQGMDAVTSQPAGTGASAGALGAREGKRRTDRFPLPSDIQQSLLLYNQQHGGRRGQSWMQAVDASVEGSLLTGVPLHQKDRTG